MNTRSTALFVGLTMAAALAMSGCGGGSSKSASGQFRTFDSALTDATQRQGTRAAAATAAGNTPNAGGGSVTQSSTAADSVAATVERAANGTISYTVGEDGGWTVNRDSARVRAEPRLTGWRGIQFHQAPGGGQGSGTGPGLYVDVYTDIEAPTTRPAATARPALVPAAVAPADHPAGCEAGGTLEAGHSCTYRSGGQTFTLEMSGDNVCFRFGAASGGCQRNITFIMSNIQGVPITLVTSGSGTTRTIDRLAIGEPERPAGTQDVPGNAAGVVFTGEFDVLRGTPGTFYGVPGTFRCQTATTTGCGQSTSNGRLTALRGTWIFVPSSPPSAPPPAETPPPAAPPAPVEMVTVQDADYLVGGIWMRVPEGATSVADYEFGAFMDGSDPFTQANLAGLTGTATYAGDARAVYSHEASNRNYVVDGDVELTADFGNDSSLGSISGTVSSFTGEGPEPGWYEGGSVVLGDAQIGNANSGFFTGDTSTRSSDPADPVLTGKWGGRFYGNGAAGVHPGAVAGTFGGATTGQSYVGIYGALRQEEEQQ